jgi:phospholipid N-methyltransferase
MEEEIANAMPSLLPEGAAFLAYTGRPVTSLPAAAVGLSWTRVGFILHNIIPAPAWAYRRISARAW